MQVCIHRGAHEIGDASAWSFTQPCVFDPCAAHGGTILDGIEPSGLSSSQLMQGVPEKWEEQVAMARRG